MLRSAYKVETARIVEGLTAFAALTTVKVEEPRRLEEACALALGGMAFADAYHLAGAGDCEAFVTFDHDLIRSAKAAGRRVREP